MCIHGNERQASTSPTNSCPPPACYGCFGPSTKEEEPVAPRCGDPPVGSRTRGVALGQPAFSRRRASETGQGIQEKYFSHARYGSNKVAILHVEGVILDGEGLVKREIERAAKDDSVKAVVLRVDSPGGTVSGSDYIYHHLTKLAEKKPIVVSMGSVAASGGYYVSMAVGSNPNTIFAEPTTWTGSIGVIIPHYDATGLMEKVGIKSDSIASHPLKGMGSFMKPMLRRNARFSRVW